MAVLLTSSLPVPRHNGGLQLTQKKITAVSRAYKPQQGMRLVYI